MGGISRSDAKQLGDYLDTGRAALVVIGKSRLQEQLDKTLTHAEKTQAKEINADGKDQRTQRAPRLTARSTGRALSCRRRRCKGATAPLT